MVERIPAIRVLLLPKDTNAYGTIFGGVILSNIDLASAIEARKVAAHRYVTKAMREVEFHEPVFLGDIVNFFTETIRIGRTSITVRVSVEAERWGTPVTAGSGVGPTPPVTGQGERVKVTQAEVVLVAVNDRGKPVSIRPELPRA
jgi:acyl-CoA thioesterase YciA